MTHILADLRMFLALGKATPPGRSWHAQGRNVMMRITLDAQHATPVRQALIRDCAGQPWTIRIAPLHGTGRVRLSLYLPRHAVDGAIQHVVDLAPSAEVGQLFEIPDAPTDAWQELMHPASASRADLTGRPDETAAGNDTVAQLLSRDHVLLGADVASKEALFSLVGRFVEERHGLPAANVVAGLAVREALGSTGLGQGVAVPHGQIRGLRRAVTLYVRPAISVPFDAPDGAPVSDIVVLLVPEWANSTHLHLLADVAQRFCDHHFRQQLHACTDAQAVCQLFAGYNAEEAEMCSAPGTRQAGYPRAVREVVRLPRTGR